jgi:LDH2 family malate/lactate/ureidoglycolate dehydrogenase
MRTRGDSEAPVTAAGLGGVRQPADDAPPRVVSARELRELAERAIGGIGAPPETAALVARSLVDGNLVGHDSHGVRRIPTYAAFVRAGQIDPRAKPVTDATNRATAVVDGNMGFGQPAARLATEVAEELAREHGTATVALRRANHVGRLGEWVGALADRGLAALAIANADPTVAPFGGRERKLGTNPLAWAVPRANGKPPVVLDWATAAMAEGKLAVLRDRNEPAPKDVVVDAQGHPSTDPNDFYAGGALLPFGAHKGYGLSVMIELMGGILSGAAPSSLPEYDGTNGTVLIAVDVARFTSEDAFREVAERYCADLTQSTPADGHDEILVPGELEARTAEQRRRDGIPVPEQILQELGELTR